MKHSLLLVALALCASAAGAATYKENDPLPPGASGKVLPLRGKILAIRGLSSPVSGTAEALAAALTELDARRAGSSVHIALSSDVLFDFDKATLRPEAASALEKVLVVIQSYPGSDVAIEGHSDAVGEEDYNQRLSEQRAESVKTWLAARAVKNPITTRGRGESNPLVPNTDEHGADSPANRQRNRRVEIVVTTR